MKRRPIEARIEAGPGDSKRDRAGVSAARFRDALSRWASGVTVVAVRDGDDGRVHATTASSFASVSAEPPRIVISLGPGAQVLPFLPEGTAFTVNVLSAGQERLARVYADAFPVGPSPFPARGLPVMPGAHQVLACRVERVIPLEDGPRLVVALVEDASAEGSGEPLVHHGREYRTLS